MTCWWKITTNVRPTLYLMSPTKVTPSQFRLVVH